MVYVLDKDGHPLMPTERHGRVKHLLRSGRAIVISIKPFTIRLTYESTGYIQPVTLGIDPGRTNIGFCAVTEEGKPLIAGQVRTRNKDIPKLMRERKEYRQKHRSYGRRDVRQRRAKTNSTELPEKEIQRILPGCEKPVACKGIRNKEARFLNRKRPEGWLTPTAGQLLQTHVNLVRKISGFLPVTQVNLELNSFAFMRLDDPSVTGKDFQEGPLKGFDRDVKAAVWHLQEGKCLLCSEVIEEYHHVRMRGRDGSEAVRNRVGLCKGCHHRVHTDGQWAVKLAGMNSGMRKRYDALGVLNQIMPALVEELERLYTVVLTDGHETYRTREMFSIPKDHHYDAYVIALADKKNPEVRVPDRCYHIRQFRRHDRQVCQKEMTRREYLLDGKTAARNRHKAIGQTGMSLEEYVKAGGRTDCLKVKRYKRIMKNPDRIMPGSVVLWKGKPRILLGCVDHYFQFDDGTKTASIKIKKQLCNSGLVFVSNS